jgi:hypothetical protein
MAAKSPMDEFKGIPGWSPEMEERYRKRIQENVEAMTTGPFARMIRTAIVSPSFRKKLENDPAGVLKEYGLKPKGESIVLVPEDRGVFPIVIPKVLKPFPLPDPLPGQNPRPRPGQGPRPRPGPDPDPGNIDPNPGGIDVGDDELFSGSRAYENDDWDISSRADKTDNQDNKDITADSTDPRGDPESRD